MYKKVVKKVIEFEVNFLKLLEWRLFMLVYRLNWIINIFKIKSMVD